MFSPRLCAMLLCGLLVSGCSSIPRRDAPLAERASAVVPRFPASIRWVGEHRRDFERRAPLLLQRAQHAAEGKPLNVLVLSGGGAGGAFGAGALVGLSRRGARPDFQIVTGMSAGALIAPLAFLGPDWDAQLTDAFSGAQTQYLMRTHWLGALFGASVYLGQPLAHLINRYVTDDLIRAVSRESRKGRLLLIATTDLDSEETVFWNLGLIAEQRGAKARQLFRDVLLASASIPGVFPPVMIRVEQGGAEYEEMHVDGSATASLFFMPDAAAILPISLEPLHGGHLYVLINGPIRVAEATTREQTLAIIRRSAVAALLGNTRSAIDVAYSVAQRHRMDIAVTDVPDVYPYGGSLQFDASRMRSLFDYGKRCALDDALWSTPIAALDQLPIQSQPPSEDTIPCPAAGAQDSSLESIANRNPIR